MNISRRRFFKGSAALIGAGTLTGVYGFGIEPYWLEFVERELPIRYLPENLKGKRLVQISDIHICSRIRESYLIESLQRIQALEPDIVVYTGDFVSMGNETKAMLERVFLYLAKGKLGTAAILGNHDYGHNWLEESWAKYIIDQASRVGIPVLRNEVITIEGLQIIGRMISGRENLTQSRLLLIGSLIKRVWR